jgi:hypothetical protein
MVAALESIKFFVMAESELLMLHNDAIILFAAAL